MLLGKDAQVVHIRGEELRQAREETHLDDTQIQKLAQKFSGLKLEKRKDGTFELSQDVFMSEMGRRIDQYFQDRIFTALDEDGSGGLSKHEFIKAVATLAPGAPLEPKVDFLFRVLDYDRTGKLTRRCWDDMCAQSLHLNHIKIRQRNFLIACRRSWKKLVADYEVDPKEISLEDFKQKVMEGKVHQRLISGLTMDARWMKDDDWEWQTVQEGPTLSEFLAKVAGEAGQDAEAIDEIVDTLHANWFDSVDSLKDCTREDWAEMKLPLRFYHLTVNKLLEDVAEEFDKIELPNNNVRAVIKSVEKGGGEIRETYMMKANLFFKMHFQTIFQLLVYFVILGLAVAQQAYHWCAEEPYIRIMDAIGPNFCVSRVAAAFILVNLGLVLFFVLHRTMTAFRSTILGGLFEFDISDQCHKALGFSIFIFGVIHMIGHCINFQNLPGVIASLTDKQLQDILEIPKIQLHKLPTPLTAWRLHLTTMAGVTGWLLILGFGIMSLTSLEKFRRKNFNTFFHLHHIYIPMIPLACIHGIDEVFTGAKMWKIFLPSIILFFGEKIYSIYKRQKLLEVVSVDHLHNCMYLKIQKPDNFDYNAGNFIWIQVPDVASLQWHPYTMTSSPDEEHISVHIRIIGDWCREVQRHFLGGQLPKKEDVAIRQDLMRNWSKAAIHMTQQQGGRSPKAYEPLAAIEDREHKSGDVPESQRLTADARGVSYQSYDMDIAATTGTMFTTQATHRAIKIPDVKTFVRVDGPIGTAAADASLFKYAMFVGGGIGVTPMASMLKDIKYKLQNKADFRLLKLYFYWTCRDQGDFDWFRELLLEMSDDEEFLEVNIYLTSRNSYDIQNFGLSLLMGESKSRDLITGLRARTIIGRPNFDKIIGDKKKQHAGNWIGVFFCGPPVLGDSIRRSCNKHSDAVTKTKFIFKKEIF